MSGSPHSDAPLPGSSRPALLSAPAMALLVGIAAFMAAEARYYTVFDDEAFSCRRYTLPAGQIISALWRQTEPDPPLYYLLVHAWMRVLGITPLAIRSLSILFFVTGIVVIGAAARTLGDLHAARWTMLVAACHPLHLLFGFAARWYALMFLCVSVLLWATAHWVSDARPARRWAVAWVLAATAMCYTNYFAPVIVGLTTVGAMLITRNERRRCMTFLLCCITAAALFAPWMPVFFGQLRLFPQTAHEPSAYLVSAARTWVALCAGDLADPGMFRWQDPGAWWVWLPMCAFLLAVAGIVFTQRGWCAWLAGLCVGCAAAGVATLTMIDKYVMSFSAAACLLIGLCIGGNTIRRRAASWLRPCAAVLLAIAWTGCFVNLVCRSNWTSVRWLDPFPAVIDEINQKMKPGDVIAAAHPSAGYYAGLALMNTPAFAREADPMARWRAAAATVAVPDRKSAEHILQKRNVHSVWLMETAAPAASAAAQAEFVRVLSRDFQSVQRAEWSPDPAAQRKDELDSRYAHPKYRIVVRQLRRFR